MTVKTLEETRKEMTRSQKQELAGAESTRPGPVFEPRVDIFETDAAINVFADMPGVEPAGLDIDLRDNLLTITGTVKKPEITGEHRLLQEYETGSFYRQFRLSNAVDQNRIDAVLKHGVLRLTLPKAEAHRPRKVDIRT